MQSYPHVVRRGSGVPIVFIHGNGVDHRLLLGLDDLFAESGAWERIYLDLPGFGKTPALAGEGGLPEIAEWCHEVVGSLVGDRPFAAVGNSLGGLIVRELVARRPHQILGFALLAPVVHPDPARRTTPQKVVLRRDPELLASLDPTDAKLFADMAVVQTEANWLRFREAALPGLQLADSGAMERLAARYVLPQQPDARIRGYDRPVLIVVGRQDHVVGFEDQAGLALDFPSATYVVLDEAGHNVHLDQPQAVHTQLRQWATDLLIH